MRILIVEDNPRMAAAIRRGLREQGYSSDVCEAGFEAEELAALEPYDLIVLDEPVSRDSMASTIARGSWVVGGTALARAGNASSAASRGRRALNMGEVLRLWCGTSAAAVQERR